MRIDISFVFGLLLLFQVYDFVTLGIGMCLNLLSDFCTILGILCYWSGQLKPKVGGAKAVTPSAEHRYLY